MRVDDPRNSRKNRGSVLITNRSEAIHRSTPDHSSPDDRQHSSEARGGSIGRPVPTSVPSFLPPPARTSPPRQPGGQRPTVNGPSFSLFNLVSHKALSLFLSLHLPPAREESRFVVVSHYRVPLAPSSSLSILPALFPPGEPQHVQWRDDR